MTLLKIHDLEKEDKQFIKKKLNVPKHESMINKVKLLPLVLI